jgi:hypothetical protein
MPIDFSALGRALERLQIAERKARIAKDGETLTNSLGEAVPVSYVVAKRTSADSEFTAALADAQRILADVGAVASLERP